MIIIFIYFYFYCASTYILFIVYLSIYKLYINKKQAKTNPKQ